MIDLREIILIDMREQIFMGDSREINDYISLGYR
jgi:hypothetical protein